MQTLCSTTPKLKPKLKLKPKGILACFICAYLAAYYIPQPVTVIAACSLLGLLFLFLFYWLGSFHTFWNRCCKPNGNSHWLKAIEIVPISKYMGYSICILLGLLMGQGLRQRAEQLQNHSSLGMEAQQIHTYFGQILRDAVPNQHGNFRFAIQLFATSDGKQLLSSARGRVFVQASIPNPLPALGQMVAIKAPIVEIKNEGKPAILFSRAGRNAIQLFTSKDFSTSAIDIAPVKQNFTIPKAMAYSIKQASYSHRQTFLGKLTAKWFAGDGEPTWQELWQKRSTIRSNFFTSLNQLFPAAGRDLFLALLFGISQDLPEQVKENFRLSGASHILALSGFHVGILAGIASFLLRPLLGLRRSLLASSLILLSYLWLVGPLPSLTRAVFMFILLSGSKFFLRRGDGFSIWALSAIWQTQVFPTAAQTLSFQLSYAALLGLILFAGRGNTCALLLNHKLQCCLSQAAVPGLLSRFMQFMLQGMAITLAVLLCSAPILIANFGQIQWIGLLASLVETPIITLYMWLSLLFWLMAYLLQEHEAWLALLQAGYRQLYHASLSPMEFFARAQPWQFYNADQSLRIGSLSLYGLVSAMLMALLYRYEISYFWQKLRPRMDKIPKQKAFNGQSPTAII